MGVDYLYCGCCTGCYNSDWFDVCKYCDSHLDHPSTHGYFCNECAEWYLVKEDKKTRRFCSENCYNEYKKIKK